MKWLMPLTPITKLKELLSIKPRILLAPKRRLSEAIEMFMDYIDFELKPWVIEDHEKSKKEI